MASKRLRLDSDSSLEQHEGGHTPSPGGGSGNVVGNGPFRGRYTRPLAGSLTAGANRFSPYSISRDRPSPRRTVPLIRATRDHSDLGASSSSYDLNTSGGFGGNSSSTAQKIIDTLSAMSAPVLNAGRVRIDSIKAMKPLSLENRGSVLTPTSKFSGPPKTSSPLLLPKIPAGSRGSDQSLNWSLRGYGIQPRMVDTGTNTEESWIANEKKGLAQSPSIPTQVVPIVANNTSATNQSPGNWLRNSPAVEMVVKKPVYFKFSQPWSLRDLERLKEHKIEKKEESSSSSLDDDDDRSNDRPKSTMVNGEGSNFAKANKPQTTTFQFSASPIVVPSLAVDKKWPLKSEKLTTADKTDSNIKSLTAPKGWNCPTCCVPNKPTASACVCCQEKNPNPVSTPAPVAKDWNCPTCCVPNKATAAACVCCQEKNPKPVISSGADSKDSGSSVAPASTFKFGFANSVSSAPTTATTSSSASTGFSFGSSPSKSAPSTDTGKGFSFGFQPSSNSKTTSSSPTKTQQSSSSTSTPTGFSFGSQSTSTTTNKPVASATPFKFGLNTSNDIDKKFDTSPKRIELWKCVICNKNVKFELHSCEGCGSPRPNEFDSNYQKPEEKPKTELKFEPVFGGFNKSGGNQSSAFSSTPISSAGGSGFSFGSPFGGGGGGTFSSSNNIASTPAGGGNTTFGSVGAGSNITTTTATAVPAGLFSGGAPSSFSSGGNSTSQGFQFGSTSTSPTKRKLDDSSEGDPAKKIATSGGANFTFGGASASPALKLKEVPTPQFAVSPTPVVSANPATPSNNAGFLEALKNASAAVKASSEKQSNTVTSTSGPPPNKMFTFGSAAAVAAPSPSSGGFFSNPNASGFASNSFGSPAGAGTFTTPSMGSNPPPAVAPVAPAPQFNLTPSFNFGAPAPPASTFNFGASPPTGAGGAGAAAPFQFAATPTGSSISERKIKRATRRNR